MVDRKILGIDPGSTKTALSSWDGEQVVIKEFLDNWVVLAMLRGGMLDEYDIVCERVESYGMAVGVEVFDTVYWSGKFHEAFYSRRPGRFTLVPRKEVKMHLCKSASAKDGNITRALKDLIGEPGTVKKPGVTFGVKSHNWQALALAVTCFDLPTVHNSYRDRHPADEGLDAEAQQLLQERIDKKAAAKQKRKEKRLRDKAKAEAATKQ